MPSDNPLLSSLRAALAANPQDVPLRLHLAELLHREGEPAQAVAEVAVALQHAPDSAEARALMARLVAPAADAPPRPEEPRPESPRPDDQQPPQQQQSQQQPQQPDGPPRAAGFDWRSAEEQLADIATPPFVTAEVETDEPGDEPAYDVERVDLRLDDVGGMADVKQRLEMAFLAPMRNPELRRLYGKKLRGGLLLYGPPGCGKTFLARAVAGELGASFMSITLSDVLDMWIGQSERNLHEIFATARRSAPCVLFLDEVDALGQKRANLRNSSMRGTVNQLLLELDDVRQSNEGVFLLAATNHPWDVDTALRRPGRLDRTILVLPPDPPAREAILRYHLRDRPVAGIDTRKIAKRTDGYSGADLAHLCETAAERALMDSVATGSARMIEMADLEAALREVRPSTDPWFAAARNVAMFANEGGVYDDLLAYLKRHGKG